MSDVVITVKLNDQTKGAIASVTGGLDTLEDSGKRAGSSLSNVWNVAGGILASNVISGLTSQIGDFFSGAMEAEQIGAQTANVIRSTGSAAGMTADEVGNLASELQKVTLFEDEAVQHGENLLLTFTNIGEDVFPLATETMLDMATAMKTDAAGGAIQLGKALNDPVAGISALSRVGVTFTDQQKKQIEAMVAAGDVAGAQKVILAELQKEFGGSARAAGETFGGQLTILKNRLMDAGEGIAQDLLPALSAVVGSADDVFNVLSDVAGFVVDNAEPALVTLGAATMYYAVTQVPALIASVTTAIPVLYAKAAALTASLGPLALAAGAIFAVAKAWDNYTDKIEGAADKTLQSREWWTSSTTVMEVFEAQSEAVQGRLQGQADALDALREAQRSELEGLGMRMTAGLVSEEQYASEMAVINQRAGAIKQATKDLESQLAVEVAAAREASLTEQGLHSLNQTLGQQSMNLNVSEEDWKAYTKTLEGVQTTGPAVFEKLVSAQLDFDAKTEESALKHKETLTALYKDLEAAKTTEQATGIQARIDEEKQSFEASRQSAALAYAEQQAQQRQHLGQMLIDYVMAQMLVNDSYKQHGGAMIAALSEQYGIQTTIAQESFGSVLAILDETAVQGGASVDSLTARLADNERQLRVNEEVAQIYRTQALAELDRQLAANIITQEQYNLKLAAIPKEVETRVKLEATQAQKDAVLIGQQLSEGVASGISSKAYRIAAELNEGIESGMTRAREKYGIQSPSRVFAEKIGVPITEGVAAGITEGQSMVMGAIGSAMGSAFAMAVQAAGAIRSAVASVAGPPQGWSWDPGAAVLGWQSGGGAGGFVNGGGFGSGGGGWGTMPTGGGITGSPTNNNFTQNVYTNAPANEAMAGWGSMQAMLTGN